MYIYRATCGNDLGTTCLARDGFAKSVLVPSLDEAFILVGLLTFVQLKCGRGVGSWGGCLSGCQIQPCHANALVTPLL